MKSYEVEIKEILSRIVKVVAVNKNQAIEVVTKKYNNEEYVLNAEDYIETKFSI